MPVPFLSCVQVQLRLADHRYQPLSKCPGARAGRSGVLDPQHGFFALKLLFDSMNDRRESGPDTIKHHGNDARALACGAPTFILDQPCSCRELHPRWSSGVLVLVEEAAETITTVDA